MQQEESEENKVRTHDKQERSSKRLMASEYINTQDTAKPGEHHQDTPDDLDHKAIQSIQEESLKAAPAKRAWWLPYTFGIVSACFTAGAYVAGAVMAVVHPAARIYHLRAWWWAFYIGSLFPVLWFDWLVSYGLKYLIEVRLLRHGMLA